MKTKLIFAAALIALMSTTAFAEDAPYKAERKDRQVTRTEFAKHADERFTKMDTNADGTLSREEFKAAHQKVREHRRDWKEQRNDVQKPKAAE